MLLPLCVMTGLTLAQPTWENVKKFEADVGCRPTTISWYQPMLEPLNVKRVVGFSDSRITPIVYIQPEERGFDFRRMNNGVYDKNIIAFARQINRPIVLNFSPEIAEWQSYKFTNTNTPKDYVYAFQRYVKLVKQYAPIKPKFMWTANVRFNGDNIQYASYYPGNDVVDIPALTGFDWNGLNEWNGVQTFSEVFGKSYEELTKLTTKKLWISETSTLESKTDPYYKHDWIKDAYAQVCSTYTQISNITWFSIFETRASWKKEADWRVDSTKISLGAFREIFNRMIPGQPCMRKK